MPSLLNELSDTQLREHRTFAPSLSALLILFHGGCLPNGLFTSLVVFLKNSCGWQLAVRGESRKPTCLHQNCVSFTIPTQLAGSVTLIASFKYLEVHVDCTIEPKIDGICTRVFRDIKSGLEASWRVLYTGKVSFSTAFFCSTCSDSSNECDSKNRHHAKVSEDKDYETCSVNFKYGLPLHESKLRWLKNITGELCVCVQASMCVVYVCMCQHCTAQWLL